MSFLYSSSSTTRHRDCTQFAIFLRHRCWNLRLYDCRRRWDLRRSTNHMNASLAGPPTPPRICASADSNYARLTTRWRPRIPSNLMFATYTSSRLAAPPDVIHSPQLDTQLPTELYLPRSILQHLGCTKVRSVPTWRLPLPFLRFPIVECGADILSPSRT